MIRTTAMFSAHTIHILHVILRDTLIFLIILFSVLFVWLKSGIHVDHFSFNHYEVDGLYIKLDKKLTLTAKEIVIPKSKKKPSFDNVDKVLDRVKYLLTFFHYIELEKVDFKDNHYKVIYADNVLFISSDDYEIAGNVWRRGHVLVADISLFYIKKEDINMVAKLNYDLRSDRLILEGKYDAYQIEGRFKAVKKDQTLEFIINSNTFSNLKTFIDRLPMHAKVNSWISEKIKARSYRLYSLRGKGRVHGSSFDLDFSSLKGNALLEDVKIRFHEKLSAVKTKKIVLRYDKNTLFFDLTDPVFRNRDLNGSRVSITNLAKGKTARLNLDIHYHGKADETVEKVLRAYHLKIPVHYEKNTKAEVRLGIPLKKTPQRHIDIFVKAHLGKGDLHLGTLKLPVQSGDIIFRKGVLNLKGIKLRTDWYAGTVNGKVDTKAKKGDLVLQAEKIEFKKKNGTLFLLKDKKIPMHIDYAKDIQVVLPTFKVKIVHNEKETTIKAADLSKIIPYLKKMEIKIDGGALDITTKDLSTFVFQGEFKRNDCFIYDQKVCYTRIPCSGTITPKGVDFYAFGTRLHFNSLKRLIEVNGLNFDLKKFLDSDLRIRKMKTKKSGSEKTVIRGKKGNIRYDQFALLTDSYTVSIFSPSGNIKAVGKLGSDVVRFSKKGNYISIEALRIHDRMLHPLINFNGLQNGRYSIKIAGTPGKLMKGEVRLEGGVLRSFKAYEKTRDFIRNNKNLSQLQDPGFGASGFKIREGQILYRIVKDKVFFDKIYVRGGTATLVGKGTLDIKTKRLNIDLAVQTVRKLGKIVGSLPVLGYILMGEDNSVTFGLKIKGTLKNPKVETSAAKEILSLPFEMIKRTLQSPAHIINTEKKKKKIKVPVIEEVVIPRDKVAP